MPQQESLNARIIVKKDGPYEVDGELPMIEQHIVTNAEGESLDYREGRSFNTTSKSFLCRCGESENKPFCDGSHVKAGFDGTETASHELFHKRAVTVNGPLMTLSDDRSLCAFARFCDPMGQVWSLVQEADPESARIVEFEVGHCPAGRLTTSKIESGESVEPIFGPSLGFIEDTAKNVSGPIWVRGGIQIVSADGYEYEVRNRVTLCRCGRSANKPFCDGNHIPD